MEFPSPPLPLLLLAMASSPLASGFASEGANMNGRYLVATGASTPGVDPLVAFPDDYGAKGHEFFDVYSPEIATQYGENFWTDQGNIPLPSHIVKRFKGACLTRWRVPCEMP